MRLRDVLYAAGLAGGVGALALAWSTHRQLAALDVARQVGGTDGARGVEAFAQFGQVQLLGFYVLALLFFAVLLITVFSRSESKPVTDEPKFESARPVPATHEAKTESATDIKPDAAITTSAEPDAVTTPTEESSTVATGVKTDEPAVIAPVETKA